MAIGLPASFSAQIDLHVDRETAREIVPYSFQLLGWPLEVIDRDTYHARVSMSGGSWGERVEVSLADPATLVIQSRGILPTQIFDWGKNKRNVDRFCEIFEAKSITESKLPRQPPRYLDSDAKTPIQRALDENSSS